MNAVFDASVVVKWFLPAAGDEPDGDRALELLDGIRRGRLEPLQPPHWLAEVAAVLTRRRPNIAERAVELLDAMEFAVVGEGPVYRRAVRMAHDLGQHVFDTLYHAVALEREAHLVTADHRYYAKARGLGRIVRLADWT